MFDCDDLNLLLVKLQLTALKNHSFLNYKIIIILNVTFYLYYLVLIYLFYKISRFYIYYF